MPGPDLRNAANAKSYLRLAFPDWNRTVSAKRGNTWHDAATPLDGSRIRAFPDDIPQENIDRVVLLDGFENFAPAQARGKGSLYFSPVT